MPNIIEKDYKWAYPFASRKDTKYIVLHHAAAKNCTADDIHRWHLNNGWAGIGYNYFVRKDGTIYRGRPEDAVGAHTGGYNSNAIGVCFEGDYDHEQAMPAAQKRAGEELVAYLKRKYPNAKVVGHRDLNATACPGRYFPFAEIANVKPSGIADSAVTGPVNVKEMCNVNLPVLRKGATTGYVKTMQILLNKYNNANVYEDGIFGSGTEKAVKNYQRSRGLSVDGIVGEKTWAQLLK